MKPLYMSATVKDSGKTSSICGLMQVLRHSGKNPAYFKPVGQRYINYKGNNVDEDAVLMIEAFGLADEPHCVSPIAIDRGFTSRFVFDPNVKPLENEIRTSAAALTAQHSMLVVEGTGHAGVGSCFGLSNARVAQLLGAEVIIITTGGIGRPLDEIALSLALFKQQGVSVMGIILNKVLPEKLERVSATVAKGLENLGTRLLGAIPYEPALSSYSVKQVAEEFGYSILCGADALSNRVEHTVVAAMEPQNMLHHIRKNTLIITPGDRIDNILISIILSAQNDGGDKTPGSCGLILSGGFEPPSTILPLLRESKIPVLISPDDTYTVSARMNNLQFKIQSRDTEKIEATFRLVKENVDVNRILDCMG